jgi:hypothetical protein
MSTLGSIGREMWEFGSTKLVAKVEDCRHEEQELLPLLQDH